MAYKRLTITTRIRIPPLHKSTAAKPFRQRRPVYEPGDTRATRAFSHVQTPCPPNTWHVQVVAFRRPAIRGQFAASHSNSRLNAAADLLKRATAEGFSLTGHQSREFGCAACLRRCGRDMSDPPCPGKRINRAPDHFPLDFS